MPKRNLVWIAVGAVLAVLLWKVPEALIRRDALYDQFGPLTDISLQIHRNYVEEVEKEQLLRGAIDGMMQRLDPYSRYFDIAEYEQFSKRIEGQFYGIGVEIDQLHTGELVIVSPIEGSPAFLADLRADDRIVMIDDTRTVDIPAEKAVELIKGEPNTSVRLTLFRPSTGQQFEKTIERKLITVPTVRGWAHTEDWEWDYVIDPEYRIGYVRILNFELNTAKQLDVVVRKLLVYDKIQGLVIDVRDNPGGLLDVVVPVADRFLDEGTIVSTRGRNTPEQRREASRQDTYPSYLKLALLVNGGSASASEILAGALKDHKRAVVVGEKTFGKGSVQTLFEVENGHGIVKLTTGYWYLPSGERIHDKGIMPDKLVELTPAERAAMIESRVRVYSTRRPSPRTTATAPATASAPASKPSATSTATTPAKITVMIDRQLQTALDILREQLGPATTAPAR
ncbi:MAG: S41 family peptidase [Phycisphaerae bacterium]|nr:S41 family peptidase [Phycisphaerae bacterium]